MGAGAGSISAELDDVRAGEIHIGNRYYLAAERPPALHVGVPPMPAHFVGREPLVAEVARRLVGGSRAISAEGLPGVGKTTLAVALTYRREVLDHFTDGVLWGGLGPQPNGMEVLASWAEALGIDASSAIDPRTRAELVGDAIGQRRFLLVIDDAWAPAENALLLRCGGPRCAHFLTTGDESIARTFAGPHGAVGIDVLAPQDALQLLTTLAPEACAADPDAAKQLVAAVGYLPLAIELMGAYLSEAENRYFRQMQTQALRTMADPAERLRQACIRLGDSRGARVTLQDTIRLSLQDLPDEAVAAFHALGAFAPKPDSFDLDAAKAVTGASPATLSRLLERNLLEMQDGALSLHQTIADVAREGCPAEAGQAHAEHYLQRVRDAGDDWRSVEAAYGQVKWRFSRLDDADQVLRFARALKQYQSIRGLREDELAWNERELHAARSLGDRQREAVVLTNRGWVYDNLGEHQIALDLYHQALPVSRAVGDRRTEAIILNNIAEVYDGLGDRERAIALLREVLPIQRETGDRQAEAITLCNMGRVHGALGEHDQALELMEQALSIQRAVGDRTAEAITLNNIATVHDNAGNPDRALAMHLEVLLIRRTLGDRQGEAVTLNNIAFIYTNRNELHRARELFNEALSIVHTIGDRRYEALILNNIGFVHERLEDGDSAIPFYQQALALRRAVGDRPGEAVTRSNLATIHRTAGRLREAVTELRQVVEIDAATRSPDLESDRQVLAEVEAELARQDGSQQTG